MASAQGQRAGSLCKQRWPQAPQQLSQNSAAGRSAWPFPSLYSAEAISCVSHGFNPSPPPSQPGQPEGCCGVSLPQGNREDHTQCPFSPRISQLCGALCPCLAPKCRTKVAPRATCK